MDLADILGRDQIVPELKASNRWEAIDELIGNLVATGKIQPGDRDAVTAAVKKRETSMSTGIGFGIGRFFKGFAEISLMEQLGDVGEGVEVFLKLALGNEEEHH